MLLRARRNDEVEEELTREALRGLGELLLERRSPGGAGGETHDETMTRKTKTTEWKFPLVVILVLPLALPDVSLHGLMSRS